MESKINNKICSQCGESILETYNLLNDNHNCKDVLNNVSYTITLKTIDI